MSQPTPSRVKGGGKRGHTVANTLFLMMFLGWANERDTKHLFCVHAAQKGKTFVTKIRNIFVSRTQILCVAPTGKPGTTTTLTK